MSLTRGLDHRDGEEVKELATCPPSPRQKVPGREQHRSVPCGRTVPDRQLRVSGAEGGRS